MALGNGFRTFSYDPADDTPGPVLIKRQTSLWIAAILAVTALPSQSTKSHDSKKASLFEGEGKNLRLPGHRCPFPLRQGVQNPNDLKYHIEKGSCVMANGAPCPIDAPLAPATSRSPAVAGAGVDRQPRRDDVRRAARQHQGCAAPRPTQVRAARVVRGPRLPGTCAVVSRRIVLPHMPTRPPPPLTPTPTPTLTARLLALLSASDTCYSAASLVRYSSVNALPPLTVAIL
ncbi:hypothetical protein GGX14DRAFT_574619 [Mycena pura]|uniref:Uncharacterized protein n=1 Tax=Mycena pura TaxID=153505 RepID=A0AAD6UZ07_9AGAR|nr:hypothetical protein GGX14DRAFT_574619 [Mycena pura]